MPDFNFQKELENSVLRADTKLKRDELLVDIFKTYVAKMMERNVRDNKHRLEEGFINAMRGYLISEFRKAKLGEYQMSEGQYSKLFDEAVKEIFNFASSRHEGEDVMAYDKNRQLSIDMLGYQNEVLRKSPGGIILPK